MSEILIDQAGQPEVIAASDGSLTVTVPIRIKRRGLRKVVTLPDGCSLQPRPWDDTPTPLQLALARGHRWLAMLESGEGGGRSLKGQSQVGDFLWVGNDPIQPLEKSASNPLICNELNFRACGLQIFDAGGAERRRGRRERNRALNGRPCRVVKSADTRRNPRKHAGSRNEKGQPRAVGLYVLVVGWQRTSNLAISAG